MVTLDPSLILNQTIALAIVLAPVEIFVLLNVIRLRVTVLQFLGGFSSPEKLKELFGLIAHGVLRAVQERAGSAMGVAARAQKGAAIDQLLQGGGAGALAALPGKIDLPVVGKVSIGEALQLFQTLKGLMGGGGLTGLMGSVNQTGGGGARLP